MGPSFIFLSIIVGSLRSGTADGCRVRKMSKEVAALIVANEAESRWGDKPIEESLDGIMDHCHLHWMGSQCFFTTQEEFDLFLTVLMVVYQKDEEVYERLKQERQTIMNMAALMKGIPVDLERAAETAKCHYKLVERWRKKFGDEIKRERIKSGEARS